MSDDKPFFVKKRIMKLEFPDHAAQDSLDAVGLRNRIYQEDIELTADRITFNEAVKQMRVIHDESSTHEIVLLAGGGLIELEIDEDRCVSRLHVFDCEIQYHRGEASIVTNRGGPYREFLLEQLARDASSKEPPAGPAQDME